MEETNSDQYLESPLMRGTIDNLSIIVAMAKNRVIGQGGKIPWHIPEDFKHFRKTTEGNTIIMGENTYNSIGHPLKNRNNIVVSPAMPDTDGLIIARSLEEALDKAIALEKPIFSAGGASIYRQTLPLARQLYISYVKGDYEGDTFFPKFKPDDYVITFYMNYPDFELVRYLKKD